MCMDQSTAVLAGTVAFTSPDRSQFGYGLAWPVEENRTGPAVQARGVVLQSCGTVPAPEQLEPLLCSVGIQ